MGATFARSHTFTPGELLTSVLQNGIETNILNNFTPAGMDDYSSTVAEMRITVDPYPAGTESQPTSLQGEIERYRYMIKQISGEAQWPIDPQIALKHFVSVLASGTNTYTATLDPAITAYTNRLLYFIEFTNASTAASTLDLNAVGAKKLYIEVNGTLTQVGNADIYAGLKGILIYDSSLDSAVGGFVIVNTQRKLSRVHVTRNTSQTISATTWTKIQWNTEVRDTHAEYDPTTNYRYTAARAKTVDVSFFLRYNITNLSTTTYLSVYKNGSSHIQGTLSGYGDGVFTQLSTPVFNIDLAATDYLEFYIYSGSGADISSNENGLIINEKAV